MTVLSRINPLTYGVDGMMQIVLNQQIIPAVAQRIFLYPIYLDTIILLIISLVMIFLPAWLLTGEEIDF